MKSCESEWPKLEKYLLRLSKTIGWKSVFYLLIKYQRKNHSDSGYILQEDVVGGLEKMRN